MDICIDEGIVGNFILHVIFYLSFLLSKLLLSFYY